MQVRVHVFGSGPRMRRIAAALAGDVAQTAVTSYADERSAIAAGVASVVPIVLLDARVAVESEPFHRFVGSDVERGAALATGFDGAQRPQIAATRYRDGSALARLQNEPLPNAALSSVGTWLEEPGESETRTSTGRSVAVHAYGRGFSGFATASRNLMIGLYGNGVDVRWQHWFPKAESPGIDAADLALLRTFDDPVVRTQTEKAILFHPPTRTNGAEFSEAYRQAYIAAPYAHVAMFEADTIPAQWVPALREASRIWVPSRFNVETFVAGGIPRDQIDLVPIGLDVEHQSLDGATLVLDGRRSFAFLSVFEWTYRKGWDILIAAWATAFTNQDDVCLYIRSHFRDLDVAQEIRQYLKRLGHDGTRIAPIIVIPDPLPKAGLAALYRSCDAFVLPSRGEGFGLPYLEAMALGLPAIGTNWSGATDFMTPRTGYLIDASLEAITNTEITRIAPVFKDQNWALPLTQSAAAQLRSVYDHRAEAATIGARGTALARTQFNRTRIGRIAAEALERIHPRTIRAKASLGNVAMEADIYVPDGRAAAARDFLHALVEEGFEPSLRASGDDTWISLLRHGSARRIKAALARSPDQHRPFIYHASLENFASGSHQGPTIVRTVATAETCKPENVRKLARADEVWVPSTHSAQRFEAAGLDPRLIAVVPQTINVAKWTPQIGGLEIAPGGTCRMLAMVNWDDRSRWDVIAAAFFRAFTPSDNVLLVLKVPISDLQAQPNFEADLQAALRGLHAGAIDLSTYQFEISVGLPNEVDFAQYVGSFDALVNASKDVGWGRPLLEAMACGVPIIAPPEGNHREFVNADNALLVEGTIDDLAVAMRRVYERPEESFARARIARRHVQANNSIETVGRLMRQRLETRIERFHTIDAPLTISLEPQTASLGVIVDAREYPEHLERCLEQLSRLTRNDLHVVVLNTFGEAVASLPGVDYVAYLQSDVILQPGWDFFLIDALRIRPLTSFALPRTFNVPGPQSEIKLYEYDPHLTGKEFTDFATLTSTTHLARGAHVSTLSCFCLMFEAAAFRAAFVASGDPQTIEPIARALCTDGRRPWLAFDSTIHNGGSAPKMMLDVRPARAGV